MNRRTLLFAMGSLGLAGGGGGYAFSRRRSKTSVQSTDDDITVHAGPHADPLTGPQGSGTGESSRRITSDGAAGTVDDGTPWDHDGAGYRTEPNSVTGREEDDGDDDIRENQSDDARGGQSDDGRRQRRSRNDEDDRGDGRTRIDVELPGARQFDRVNPHATMTFAEVFSVCNRGEKPASIWLEFDPVETSRDEPAVTVHPGVNVDRPLLGEDAAIELEPGSCHPLGMTVRTHGVEPGTTLVERVLVRADRGD